MPRKKPLFDPSDLAAGEWRDAIEIKTAELSQLRTQLAELDEQAGPIGLSLALNHDGAEALAMQHRRDVETAKSKILNCESAIAAAQRALAAAQSVEEADNLDRHISEAQAIVQKINQLASSLHALLAGAGSVTEQYFAAYRELARYRDLPEVARHGMPGDFAIASAVCAAGGRSLQRLLGVELVAPGRRHGIHEVERDRWARFLAIETKTEQRAMRLAKFDQARVEAAEADVLVEDPSLVPDADESDFIAKTERLQALVLERLERE